jgi:ubiquinone/menaquinone biosynthesis C-methylase UbiE
VNERVDFNPLAADYERFRTGYGGEMFRAIAARLTDSHGVILDLACGTGLSTLPLRGIFDGTVIGADVAPELLRRAPRERDGRPIVYIRADAVQLPFRGEAFDAVTCGQAMHWMNPARVLPEARRILKPGGWFFAFWKYPMADEPYQRLADEILTRVLGRATTSAFTLKEPPPLARYGFRDVSEERFELLIPFTVEDYVGFMRSRRRIQDLAGNRTEEFLREFSTELCKVWPPATPFTERNVVYLFIGHNPQGA